MKRLKSDGIINRWSTTVLEPIRVSAIELKIVTRKSFQSNDFLQDMIRNSLRPKNAFASVNLINLCFLTTIIGLVSHFLLFPNHSTLEPLFLISCLLPFGVMGIGFFAPDFIASIDDEIVHIVAMLFPQIAKNIKYEDGKERKRRICYHEAGHFLAGYLCGVPVIEYDVSGKNDAGISVLVDLPILRRGHNPPTMDRKSIGGLLVVAMAGIVAESLVYGVSKGGKQDFPIALEVLKQLPLPNKTSMSAEETEDYLRWALLKAVILLRMYVPVLVALAEAMHRNAPLAECLSIVESTACPTTSEEPKKL
eukprot:scaffold9485_cov248-Ochromonas_danica.AAC.5